MQCLECQHENNATANFCEECGTRMIRTCPDCGHEVRPSAKFCEACGHALAATSVSDTPGIPSSPFESTPTLRDTQVESPPAETHTADAERRQLTVMFCDLVDSTALSTQLDLETLREVIRSYQASCDEVIQRFEGHIAQYLGDGLLVYFGYPQAHEDDAQRAVLAGLGIVDAIAALNPHLERDHGIELAVRLGIHTGLVVVGEIGGTSHQEQLALGETPNIAARLESLAQPGTVVISDDTRHLVSGAFNYDELGTPELKGVSESIPVFRVLGLSAAASRFEAANTTLTPMVGREVEVDLLMRCWEQVLEGEGQVVLLNGSPGIGKSRLLQALCARLADTPHVRLRYQCSPYHTNSMLYPIATQVMREMRLPADAASGEKLGRLEALVAQTGLPVEEAVPLFATMLSIPTDDHYPPVSLNPQRQKERTLELFAQGLVNLSRQDPVLFLFEDMHWSDPTSLEVLSLIIDQVQDTQVLVVLTYRPEFEPAWRDDGHVTTYTLNRLSRRQTIRLVDHMTEGKALPAEVLDQIVGKTDGIPLFVEELTKHVLESEWLMDAGESYRLTSALPALAIPATLQDSLMARLDRLAEGKEVAQLGAIIGREFSYAVLRAVSPLSDTALQDALGQLLDADLISQRGQAPDSTYSFKHALIQDTAYQSMLRNTRQQAHQEIAQVLETQFAEIVETQPELVAQHYTEAGVAESAVGYWQQAGQRATQRSANPEAIGHFTRGLEQLALLPDTPARAQRELVIQTRLGPVLMMVKGGGAPEVEQTYARARDLCRQVGDTAQLFPVLWGLWMFSNAQRTMEGQQELEEQLLRYAQETDDPALLLQAHHAAWTSSIMRGTFAAARAHTEHGITLYDPQLHHSHTLLYAGHDPGICALLTSAWSLWFLGYPDQSLVRDYEVQTLAQELSHPPSLAIALASVANHAACRRDYPAAQEHAEAALTLVSNQSMAFSGPMATSVHGWVTAKQGRRVEGLAQLLQGLANIEGTGTRRRIHFHALLAEVYSDMGQVEQGLAVLAEGLARTDQSGARYYEAELHRLKGELLLALRVDHRMEVETCFHQALAVSRHQQAKSLELRAAMSMARLWQQEGKQQEAHELLAPVYGWFTEGFDTADLIDAKTLLDELRK